MARTCCATSPAVLGASSRQAIAACTFADDAKAQYQQYLNSDVVSIDSGIVVVPKKS
jgi:hypothetical protein